MVLGLAFAIAACGDQVELVEDTEVMLGAAGESCTSRKDCVAGLACLDNRCVDPATAAPDPDGGMEMVTDTRGAAGESCTRRADCRAGNACVDNVCVSEESLPEGMLPSVRGERGESCQARNDCANDLACIMERCTEHDFAFDVQTKQCFRVQCEADADCCESFVAPVNCPSLQVACDGGDAASCSLFQAQCVCRLGCQANLCAVADMCVADTNCFSPLRCFDGRCAQCMVSTDCTGTDQQCVAGVCRAACQRNEQCPLFHACQSGECVEVGCQSARECYFATMNPLSTCQDGECLTPCENDAECGPLQICETGSCKFVGCETNEECRVLLGLASVPGSDRAVCREPDR
jgi:hypothetical protein